ncbi:hypothetical protein E2C01_009807 [Portunus trituberculatus]|uniref:Uncharacterized protein n=1 Tax=Portunus trituberculatus TaxID=210409 RepID=A0A5B7D6R6_PORTR|nr:hypothetical protein [Portunus trituberculatus]
MEEFGDGQSLFTLQPAAAASTSRTPARPFTALRTLLAVSFSSPTFLLMLCSPRDNSRPSRRLIHYLRYLTHSSSSPPLTAACTPAAASLQSPFSATLTAQTAVTLHLNFRLKMVWTKRFSEVRFTVCWTLL